MRVYRIYSHPELGHKAVPVGFSFAAFLTSILWTAANNLWGRTALLLVCLLLLLAAIIAGNHLQAPLLTLAAACGLALIPLWAGMRAQDWYCRSLERKGYQLQLRIKASSPQLALQAFKTAQKQAQKPQQELQSLAGTRDFRQIRDNLDAKATPDLSEYEQRYWKKP